MSVTKTMMAGIVGMLLASAALATPPDVTAPAARNGLDAGEGAPAGEASRPVLSLSIFPPALQGVDADWHPATRPMTRDAGQRQALTSALAGLRPMARPLAMVRYPVIVQHGASLRPVARPILPDTRWDHRADAEDWTRAVLSALNSQRNDLSDIVPADIGEWCPAYAQNSESQRDAFWVGMISALARYESRHDPRAVGGGGQWFGLLQISPATAAHYGCAARSGDALLDAEANLSCGARIMTATVRRDRAVALHDGRWRGVAADWGPMTDAAKRAEMAAWTREQDYCRIVVPQQRPMARPAGLVDPTVAEGVVAVLGSHGPEAVRAARPVLRPISLTPDALLHGME